MATYVISDEGAIETIQARNWEQAERKAREWLEGGSWDRSQTIWLDARVERLSRGKPTGEFRTVTLTLPAEEPDCLDGEEHDWQSPVRMGGIKENPGVWGHGGGVVIHECCMRCGCGRITDTWAQRPDTGEQGLRSVEYRPGMYRDELAQEAG